MNTGLFLSIMGLASAISMGRIFVIGVVLERTAFGTYATVVAAGAFASWLLSCGMIEQTSKAYPRLWAEQRPLEVLRCARTAARRLLARAVLFMAPLAVVAA